MCMGMVAESTFFRIQDAYCIEPVQEYWEKTRAEVIQRLREKDHVVVLGESVSCFCQQSLHHLLSTPITTSVNLICYISVM